AVRRSDLFGLLSLAAAARCRARAFPVGVPVAVDSVYPQGEHMFGMLDAPPGAGPLQALLGDVAMGAFDLGADRQSCGQGLAIVPSQKTRLLDHPLFRRVGFLQCPLVAFDRQHNRRYPLAKLRMRPQRRHQRLIAQLPDRHPSPPAKSIKPNLPCIGLNRTRRAEKSSETPRKVAGVARKSEGAGVPDHNPRGILGRGEIRRAYRSVLRGFAAVSQVLLPPASFESSEVERAFLIEYARLSGPQRRIGIWLALL